MDEESLKVRLDIYTERKRKRENKNKEKDCSYLKTYIYHDSFTYFRKKTAFSPKLSFPYVFKIMYKGFYQ